MRRSFGFAALLVLASLLSPVDAAPRARKPRRAAPRRPSLELVYHIETLGGETVDSHGADAPINPASVVKVATSWWALEKLGPELRYETRLLARGSIDSARGVLRGDLYVEGSADPDFQLENAFLVAAALNHLGVRQVSGSLTVNHTFWIGWEDGSAGMERDPERRGVLMAQRLRRALDSRRWDRFTRVSWNAFAARRGLFATQPPRVSVSGSVRVDDAVPEDAQLLFVHRSKPLAQTLRRFNCFSNNDIERVGALLGPAAQLGDLLAAVTDAPPASVQISTMSGLGENRITPRIVVRMMKEFRRAAEHVGMGIESLLPVAGCDPGTVSRFFPQFVDGPNATSLVGKTGTLTSTDGGVSVLAGFLNTGSGEVVFCVAAPRAAGRVRHARRVEESWLLDLVARRGGPQPRRCAPPLGFADSDAEVVLATGAGAGAGPAGGSGPRQDSATGGRSSR